MLYIKPINSNTFMNFMNFMTITYNLKTYIHASK